MRPHRSDERSGVVSGLALIEAVARDRRAHSELRDVEWGEWDCPRRRGDVDPCIHVGCRWHMCSDITAHGGVWVDPRFEEDPYSVPLTCVLDAHEGEWTLDEIAQCWHLTRERIRQIQEKALAHPRRGLALRGARLDDLVGEQPPLSGLASIQGGEPLPPGYSSNHRAPVHADRFPCRHVDRVAEHPAKTAPHAELPPSLAPYKAVLEDLREAHWGWQGLSPAAKRARAREVTK